MRASSRLSVFWPLSLPKSKPITSRVSYLEVSCSLFRRFNPNNLYCIGNVFYDTLICTAAHTAGIDRGLRKAILASIASDEALKAVESMVLNDPMIDGLIGTTRAVDIISGGVKAHVKDVPRS